MSKQNDPELELLSFFNERLFVYINKYMANPDCNTASLELLLAAKKKINDRLTVLLSGKIGDWTKESEDLYLELQEKNQEIEQFIFDVGRIKDATDKAAAVLGLVDKALALAAGIAAKCA